jgi:uncharacterized lipoprotein YajG
MNRMFISPRARRAVVPRTKAGRALPLLALAALLAACQSVPTTHGAAPALAPLAPLDTTGAEHYTPTSVSSSTKRGRSPPSVMTT